MPINFIPNDPMAQVPMLRQKEPRPDRPANRAGLVYASPSAQVPHDVGTPEFLYWQCREAALLALEVWEGLNGPLQHWCAEAPNPRKLGLLQNAGDELNAYYDRESLSFFHHTAGGKTTDSGASTDVVAHEAGHAFLDALRPDLWGSSLPEAGAFHEAFGDCMALLTAFSDQATRTALLGSSPVLGAVNFVETTAEDLSEGVRLDPDYGPDHPAAAPRQALNTFMWQLPSTLPKLGPPPVLTSEVHSFARVFTGCFYDTIRNIFAPTAHNDAALLQAVQTAGRLVITAASQAPETPRFFQAVGRVMVNLDQQTNAGVNRKAISDAFANHGIALGSAAMLAATASLAGGSPRRGKGKKAVLHPVTARDLKQRLGVGPGVRFTVSAGEMAGSSVVHAVHRREVPLTSLSNRLKGVVAIVNETTMIGSAGARAALLGPLPEATATSDEVHTFVESLLKSDAIAFDGKAEKARKASALTATAELRPLRLPTHAVVARKGKKVLTRVRFACG